MHINVIIIAVFAVRVAPAFGASNCQASLPQSYLCSNSRWDSFWRRFDSSGQISNGDPSRDQSQFSQQNGQQSNSQTQTQTTSQQPVPSAEDIARMEAMKAASQMDTRASTYSAGQEQARQVALGISSIGASSAATIAIRFCADAALSAKAEEPFEDALSKCHDSLRAAEAMAGGEKVLKADAAVLGREEHAATFEKLEAGFGIKREQFAAVLLKTGSGIDALRDLVVNKLKSDRLSEINSKSVESSADANQAKELDLRKVVSKPSLRDQMRKALGEAPEYRAPASVDGMLGRGTRVPQGFDNIEPLSAREFLGAGVGVEDELTIFDVIHRKYEQLWTRR